MLSADDFLEFYFAKGQAFPKRHIRSLANETPAVLARLAEEFLEIVIDPNAKLGRRSSAAVILGGSAEAFGIKHSELVLKTLSETVEREFFQDARMRRLYCEDYKRERVFFKSLIICMILIDRDSARAVAGSCLGRLEGSGHARGSEIVGYLRKIQGDDVDCTGCS